MLHPTPRQTLPQPHQVHFSPTPCSYPDPKPLQVPVGQVTEWKVTGAVLRLRGWVLAACWHESILIVPAPWLDAGATVALLLLDMRGLALPQGQRQRGACFEATVCMAHVPPQLRPPFAGMTGHPLHLQ